MQDSDHGNEDKERRVLFYQQTLLQVLGCEFEELELFYDLEERFPGVTKRTIEIARRDSEYPTIGFFLSEAKHLAVEGFKGVLTRQDPRALNDVGLASNILELKQRYVWVPKDWTDGMRVAGKALAGFVYGDIDRKTFLEERFAVLGAQSPEQ